MKKHISLILVLTLLLTAVFSFGSVAFASSLVVTPNPTSMVSGGDVMFHYSVTNDSGAVLGGQIMYGSTPVADVSAADGMSVEGDFTMNVSDSMLGQTLTFTLGSLQATAKVDKKVLTTQIAATPSVPRTLYGEGDAVKFEFKIENQGETTLNDIVISAPELESGKALNTGFSLAPGASETKKYSYTMAKDITVNPVINFTVDGVAQAAYVMTPVTLTLESRNVKAVLAADNAKPAAGDEVTFTLTLNNGGNVPYKDITVLANGEEQDFPSTLDAGGTSSGTFKLSFLTSTEVSCSISLKDHTGTVKQINSNSLSIELPVDATTVDSKLTFTMNVDRPQLTSAGTVNFTGLITNGTDYELTNIKVDEATLGNVFSANSLAAGGTASVPYSVDVNETATYTFVLTATDKDGNTYTKTADPIAVTIQSASAEPTPGFDDAADVAETLAPDGNLGLGSIGTLGIIAIVLVVLIIGVGVALFVLWKKGQITKKPTTPPGRKRPVLSKGKKPGPQKSYRDRNNF